MALTPSPAVVRATDVLRHLAAQPTERFTVSELARAVGVPRATCDTLLLALADGGFVRRDGELRYGLGAACIVVGDAARVANPTLRAAGQRAEALARAHGAVTAVSIREDDETRVVDLYDFGPPIGFRARVGEAVQLVPPFGATFVAWDDDASIDAWLARADPPLDDDEVAHYRAALDAVRRRGYSVTLVTARQPTLIEALDRVGRDASADARRARDEAVRQMTHTEYLAAEVEGTVRLAQVSAPVFGVDGTVGASIMLLGPAHDVTADEVATMGGWVAEAAAAVSR